MANAKCLGVPRAQGEIILVTDASNVGGGGTLFQWQALEKEEFDSAISQWGTDGLNRDGTLKHSYPDDKWVLVPLGHWNWKWNQARGSYSIYEQELLAGMLVLSFQARLLGSNPVVWLCDQEPVRTFQKGPPPEKAKLRRWWTYLSQLRLTVHHIQGVKNECADYTSCNNFDDLIGARSEALAKEAVSRMDVHLLSDPPHEWVFHSIQRGRSIYDRHASVPPGVHDPPRVPILYQVGDPVVCSSCGTRLW